jgi:polysaccharide deacetylase 2 family uncharacterized protein YibQ
MAVRKSRKSSTPRLAGWGILMLLLGMGLGALLTTQGCRPRKGGLPGEEEPAPRPAPRPGRRENGSHGQAGAAPQAGPEAPAPKAGPETPAPKAGAAEAGAKAGSSPHPEPAAPKEPAGLPRFALVIDDLGYAAPELVTRLCAQSVAFDVAVLPYQEFSHASAEIAYERGKEVMLHLPMEPLGYPGPGKDPGPGAVLYDLGEAQVRERVRKMLADIPHRQGANNHMGSRVTPDRTRMTWVLQEVRAAHCFFVDSRTEKDSVAYAVAQELQVPTALRKVFLDDDKDTAAIAKQWERALALARKDGEVLAIGHIYPETVAALETLVPAAKGKVTFVKASQLAK